MERTVAIRPAVLSDAAGIARVHVQAWDESYRGIVPDAAIDRYSFDVRHGSWRKWLESESWHTFVAENGGEIVGFACAFADTTEPGYDVYLNTLYVLKAMQRRGIARDLLRALARPLLDDGLSAMWWLTLRDNPACAFYERIGAQVLRDQAAPAVLGPQTMDRVFGLDDIRSLL